MVHQTSNDYASYFGSSELRQVGFDRDRARIFLSLWSRFGNRSYLKRAGARTLDRDVKRLYVAMDRATQDKTDLIGQIERLRSEIRDASSEEKKLKTAVLDSMEKRLDAKRVQYEELETRFKFLNLVKTLAETRSILGDSLIRKVDNAVRNTHFTSEVDQEIRSMTLNHTEIAEAMDKLGTSIDVYVKSAERDNEREVLY
ncbi:MAG: hypothetical protein QW597_07015 [Thermoplasmataceae archaeon]